MDRVEVRIEASIVFRCDWWQERLATMCDLSTPDRCVLQVFSLIYLFRSVGDRLSLVRFRLTVDGGC